MIWHMISNIQPSMIINPKRNWVRHKRVTRQTNYGNRKFWHVSVKLSIIIVLFCKIGHIISLHLAHQMYYSVSWHDLLLHEFKTTKQSDQIQNWKSYPNISTYLGLCIVRLFQTLSMCSFSLPLITIWKVLNEMQWIEVEL